MEFWDPHFHIWDLSKAAPLKGAADPDILLPASPKGDPIYDIKRLSVDLACLDGREVPLIYSGGCFVEVMSVCHPKTKTADELNPLCVQEAHWVAREMPSHFFSCPSVVLQAVDAGVTLAEIATVKNVRGVRQILNYRAPPADPKYCHPRNTEDFLALPAFRDNFKLLEKNDLHFECQLESPQFESALKLFTKHPDVPIVINHLGSPDLDDLSSHDTIYWKGMQGFADLPQVVIKLSMLCRIDPDWDENKVVVDAVHRIITLFGPERCFFASNYPVDIAMKWPAERLFPAFIKLASPYSAEVQAGLFALNARRAYRALIFNDVQETIAAVCNALESRDLFALVACHSRSHSLQVLHNGAIHSEHDGHVGLRHYFRTLFNQVDADTKIVATKKGKVGTQAIISADIGGMGSYQLIVAFETDHHISSTIVIME